MSREDQQRWCLFTAAGDHNVIRLWRKDAAARRWDLVVGYYGDNDQEFSEISKLSSHAFCAKGGKFQILKSFVQQNPRFFDQYSYVWVCDDDIQMSAAQIDESFSISESLGFWIAQPAFAPEGKNYHPVTIYGGPRHDYRAVNFIECGVPIFRRCKLIEFLAVFDESLRGWGIDYWYMNFFRAHELGRFRTLFKAHELGRFAIINKVQVTNPHDDVKGGRETDRLQPVSAQMAAFMEVKAKYGLVVFPHKIFASRKIPCGRNARPAVTGFDVVRQISIDLVREMTTKFLQRNRMGSMFRSW